jgi:hypothetical protein
MPEYHIFTVTKLYFHGCLKKDHVIFVARNGHTLSRSILIRPTVPTPSLVEGSAEMGEIKDA